MPLAVDVQAEVPRLEPAIEITAYFVVAEALTNVVKHAHARQAWIMVSVWGEALQISVRDNGTGGADPSGGTGLIGLFDRDEASQRVAPSGEPAWRGTTIRATLPLRGARAEQVLFQARSV